jgi:hypothetical protein
MVDTFQLMTRPPLLLISSGEYIDIHGEGGTP